MGKEMEMLWREVEELIARNARHIKTGMRLGEAPMDVISCNLVGEAQEFRDADGRDEAISELGDVLGIVMHAAQCLGVTMDYLARVERKKLAERFEAAEVKPEVVSAYEITALRYEYAEMMRRISALEKKAASDE